MYRFNIDYVIEEKNLTAIIDDFKSKYIPRFNKLERYYNVDNEILKRTMKNSKPNNKLAHGFAKYITRMATGYFMGKGIRYILEDKEAIKYKEFLMEILNNNYTDNNNFEVAKEASKKGIAYELLYINEESKLRTVKLDAEEVIPIYSVNIGEFIVGAIRIWQEKDINNKTIKEYASLYTDKEIYIYEKEEKDKEYKLKDIETHYLGDVPIIVYWNNEERTGDYEDVLSLIDAYDKSQSDSANDSEYLADAYFYIVGASGGLDTGNPDEDEDSAKAYRTLRQEKVLVLEEKGQAGFIVKDVNDTALENYKNRLYRDLFFIAQVPPLTDESFAGNLTGVAIRYKLIGLEELTTEKEHKFLSAQKKKIRIITDYINTKNNKNYNPDLVEIKTERNFIDNLTETIEQVGKLEGVISKETQLSLLPFIKDVGEEINIIKSEDQIEHEETFFDHQKEEEI